MSKRPIVVLAVLFLIPVLSIAQTLTANPNPLPAGVSTTTLRWNASASSAVDIRVGSPTGVLFVSGSFSGSATTGPWVQAGLTFYLLDQSTQTVLAELTMEGAVSARLSASPNPLPSGVDVTTVNWNAPGATLVDIRIDSPSGPLFATGGASGSEATGPWAQPGLIFYLLDHYTQSILAVLPLSGPGLVTLTATPNPLPAGVFTTTLNWSAPGTALTQLRVGLPTGTLFAEGGPSGSVTTGSWATTGLSFYLVDASSNQVLASVALEPPTTSSLTANPNPLPNGVDVTTLTWSAPEGTPVEIHIGSPTGTLFVAGGSSGSAATGPWASTGTTFYLIDANLHQTLASVTLQAPTATLTANPDPPLVGVDVTTVSWNAPDSASVELHVGAPNGTLFAAGGPTGSATTGNWASPGQTFYLVDHTTQALLAQLTLTGNGGTDLTDTVVPGPMTLTQQIAGDLVQVYNFEASQANMYGQPTNTLAQSTAVGSGHLGVWGFDLGPCTLIPTTNDLVCITGDVESTVYATTPQPGWQNFSRQTNTCGTLGAIDGGSLTCLSLKTVWAVPNRSGSIFDPSGCNALPGVVSALVGAASNTPSISPISYTGCNPITFFTNSSRMPATQPMSAGVTVTLSATSDDLTGRNLNISAGHEFGGCAVPTFSGAPNLLCSVVESRIDRSQGSSRPQYYGATVLQQTPVSNLYSGGVLQTNLSSDLQFTASYTGPSATGGFLSHAPPITALQGLIITLTTSSPVPTYSVTSSTPVFESYMSNDDGPGCQPGPGTPGVVDMVMETSNANGTSDEGLIRCYLSPTQVTVTLASSSNLLWVTGTSQAVTIQPDQGTNVGKFSDSYPYYVSASALATWPWRSSLPGALQQATDGIVCFWGASFSWRRSNLYFGCSDVDTLASATYAYNTNGGVTTGGLSSMWYLTGLSVTGVPSWTQGHEELAIKMINAWSHPLNANAISQDCIGEHSVDYSPNLGRWVLSYGSAECTGMQIRTAINPWGPWSAETNVMNNATLTSGGLNSGNWATNWMSLLGWKTGSTTTSNVDTYPAANTVPCPLCLPGGDATNVMWEGSTPGSSLTNEAPFNNSDSDYGLYWYPGQEHVNADGTVTKSAHVSMYNPYNVFDALITFTP